MLKRARISFIPLSVAWLVIFLHGVIPHNHSEVRHAHCNMVVHCCSHSHETGNEIAEDGSTPSAIFSVTENTGSDGQHSLICHFTSGPFHPLDNDQPYYGSSAWMGIVPLQPVFNGRITVTEPHLPGGLKRPLSLRAPPLLAV